MFCKHCGNQMPDDAVFCAKCGTPVSNTARQTVNSNAPSTSGPTAQRPSAPVQPKPSAPMPQSNTAVRKVPAPPAPPAASSTPTQPARANAAGSASAAQASPLRFVEGSLAIVLIIMLLVVPFVDLSLFGSQSIPSVISFLSNYAKMMGQFGDTGEMTLYMFGLGALLAVAIICGLVTAFMTFVKPARKVIPVCWGMFVCVAIFIGLIFVVLNQINGSSAASASSSFGVSVPGVGPNVGAWACLVGSLALGILDVVRASKS